MSFVYKYHDVESKEVGEIVDADGISFENLYEYLTERFHEREIIIQVWCRNEIIMTLHKWKNEQPPMTENEKDRQAMSWFLKQC